MQMAKSARRSPRLLAEELRARLLADPEVSRLVDKIEVAGPGFLNFTLARTAYAEVVAAMLSEGEAIGRGPARPHPRVNLEFVSVNPNGPLHVGHGRYAAYGDALHRLLAFSGLQVSTEFYINDYGRQMDRFGRSIAARYAQALGVDLPVPADGYQGEYVKAIASLLQCEVGDRYLPVLRGVAALVSTPAPEAQAAFAPGEMVDDEEGLESPSDWPVDPAVEEAVAFFRSRGCALMLEGMREELAAFGVEFDCWFSETALHTGGRLEKVVSMLLEKGEAYRLDDAVWLRTTSRGDDKDRVLIRSNGHPTYFAADIAYHEDKLERGFEHLINIWGADHHGYVPRMKAAVEILAGRPGVLEVIIGQLVNLMEEGETRQMSTRRGEMVTLAELIQAIGVDAARFFLVMRSHDQTLDLDLGLARRQSQENPVYYVQYAHARIASIIRNVPVGAEAAVPDDPAAFASPYERALVKRLESFSWVVQDAAERRAPHRIAAYSQELAADFHVFYKHCRVIGVAPALTSSRLALCLVTKRVIARCLDLVGVSAPESM
jgi:arginyl-tRNA synthetase